MRHSKIDLQALAVITLTKDLQLRESHSLCLSTVHVLDPDLSIAALARHPRIHAHLTPWCRVGVGLACMVDGHWLLVLSSGWLVLFLIRGILTWWVVAHQHYFIHFCFFLGCVLLRLIWLLMYVFCLFVFDWKHTRLYSFCSSYWVSCGRSCALINSLSKLKAVATLICPICLFIIIKTTNCTQIIIISTKTRIISSQGVLGF